MHDGKDLIGKCFRMRYLDILFKVVGAREGRFVGDKFVNCEAFSFNMLYGVEIRDPKYKKDSGRNYPPAIRVEGYDPSGESYIRYGFVCAAQDFAGDEIPSAEFDAEFERVSRFLAGHAGVQ